MDKRICKSSKIGASGDLLIQGSKSKKIEGYFKIYLKNWIILQSGKIYVLHERASLAQIIFRLLFFSENAVTVDIPC